MFKVTAYLQRWIRRRTMRLRNQDALPGASKLFPIICSDPTHDNGPVLETEHSEVQWDCRHESQSAYYVQRQNRVPDLQIKYQGHVFSGAGADSHTPDICLPAPSSHHCLFEWTGLCSWSHSTISATCLLVKARTSCSKPQATYPPQLWKRTRTGVTSAPMLRSRDAQSSDLSKTECNKDTKGRPVVGCWSQDSPGQYHFKWF